LSLIEEIKGFLGENKKGVKIIYTPANIKLYPCSEIL